MEFDDEKYCNFSLLEKRQGQKIVLGLINSQTSWKTRKSCLSAQRKHKHVDPKQICIATQYVFASTEVGNLISEEGQWRKLDLVHELVESLNVLLYSRVSPKWRAFYLVLEEEREKTKRARLPSDS